MNIIIVLVFFLSCVAVLARSSTLNEKIQGITPKPPLLHNVQQQQPQIDDTDYWNDDDFVPYKSDRHDMFDWRLLRTMLLQDFNNVIISPFSIKLLLVLLLEASGAETPTQRELSSVLPNLKSSVLVRELYKKYLDSLREENVNYDLKIGTKIFVDQYIQPRQRYAAIIRSNYEAEIENLDFKKASNVADVINNWCKNATNGYVKDLVQPGDVQNAVMLMLNAIYFNGSWKRQFSMNNTFEQPFFVTPSTQIKAKFMTQTNNFYFFESTKLNAKIIRIPYKGRKFSMTLVLPNAKAGLDELIRELEGDQLKRLQWLMDETVVTVTIPKFKFDYTAHMKEVLQSLGITMIFSQNASLPGLARGSALNSQLRVSNIIQKSGLIVHESGTTAYTATEVILSNKISGEEFNANRPFAFFIEDESTGTILFAGKVVDPTK